MPQEPSRLRWSSGQAVQDGAQSFASILQPSPSLHPGSPHHVLATGSRLFLILYVSA